MMEPPGPGTAGVPLLATKLNVPRWRPGQVSRPRLLARLGIYLVVKGFKPAVILTDARAA